MSSPTRCVCPGSYDPVTAGHLDVVYRAATLFDEVVVAVVHNPAKSGAFSIDEREDLIAASLDDSRSAGVSVARVGEGLLVDFCTSVGATAIVKGLRGGTDFAYELPMALMNRRLTGIETVFLPGDPNLEHISSSLIKDVVAHGGDATGMVPEPVLVALHERLRSSR